MSVDWENEADKLDAVVDSFFGEPVRLVPTLEQRFTGRVVDPNRQSKDTVGVFLSNDEIRAAPLPGQGNVGTTVSYGLAIRAEYFTGYKQNDWIMFLKPMRQNMKTEISIVGPNETGRIILGLLRI